MHKMANLKVKLNLSNFRTFILENYLATPCPNTILDVNWPSALQMEQFYYLHDQPPPLEHYFSCLPGHKIWFFSNSTFLAFNKWET